MAPKVKKEVLVRTAPLPRPNTKTSKVTPKPLEKCPGRNKLDHYAIIKFPLTTESALKKTEDHNTLVLIVVVKANKHQIKLAVKKLYDIDVTKVNTLDNVLLLRIRADNEPWELLIYDVSGSVVVNLIGDVRDYVSELE
ncbi:60S ribosomal protein L23a-like [Trichosurus vulpecula]|uniref:60S ribosomal protein L23a-like n=1 Tax=Trichosurus vulpecula TaxID=9337 RepID=UPI00186B3B81|nr:60S ribosomal protein L23a-like [Trichosurus vulpecula]